MKNQSKNMIVGVVLAAGLMGMSASAAILIERQDGSAENPFAGWASEEIQGGTVHDTVSGDQPNGPLHLNPATTDGSIYQDVHFTGAGALTGDLTQYTDAVSGEQAYLRFDFYASADGSGAGAPEGLGFYLADTGGAVWYYDIDTTYIQDGWNSFAVQLDVNADAYNGGGWYGYDSIAWGSSLADGDFAGDIAQVGQVGLWVAYNTMNNTQDHLVGLYGIQVPEPETYLILGMALLSVAIVFRKRISESMAEARAMMQL